jgi:DNA-binding Xre family transcriptional regulator
MSQHIECKKLVLSIQYVRLVVKLREAMVAYRRRTGVRLTYASLSRLTGVSKATLQSLGTRRGYNTRLSTVARLCQVLECAPGDLLELTEAGEGSS